MMSHPKKELYPQVEDLYKGKSVLITGAAGYLGMILLETLLRNAPDVTAVYILLRGKKSLTPADRKEKIFEKDIFNKLKKDRPEFADKVRLVSGDVSFPNLGMSEEDLQEVIENVSIVFHFAAVINFVKPLRELLHTNVTGTHNVVELCKQLKTLEVLVYSSTICSNCNRHIKIEEQIYRLPFSVKKFLNEIENGTDESLESLVSQCYPHWPNNYTFSKCLAENVLLESASEVPFAVIRPSIVASIWKEPHPGFAEQNSAFALLCAGVGKGFVKVVLADPEVDMDFMPADIVGHVHAIAAWKVASGRSHSPFVVNCSSYGVVHWSWQKFASTTFEMAKKNHPMPNCFRKINRLSMTRSVHMFRVLSFYEHYVPAYVMDFLLRLSGKKTKLVSLYKLYDKAAMSSSFYNTVNMTYVTDNLHGLEEHRDQKDIEKFYTNISKMDLIQIVDDVPKGNFLYNWKIDKLTKEERLKKAEKRHLLTSIVQYAFLALLFLILSFVFWKISDLTGML